MAPLAEAAIDSALEIACRGASARSCTGRTGSGCPGLLQCGRNGVQILFRQRDLRGRNSQPSTCSGDRAPTIAPLTPGQDNTHAIATALTVVPWRPGNRLERIAKRDVPLELRRLEFEAPTARQSSAANRLHPLHAEGLGHVSKDALAIAVYPSGAQWTTATTESAMADLVTRLTAIAPTLVVLEATGGYETAIAAACAAEGCRWRSEPPAGPCVRPSAGAHRQDGPD